MLLVIPALPLMPGVPSRIRKAKINKADKLMSEQNPHWREFRPSGWTRSDMAGAAQPHGSNDEPEADYWHAWPPYITGDKSDLGHPSRVMRRRFKTKEAAMAYADRIWPIGRLLEA
ncbi:hypothetical protein [Pseudomonas aeruginosa]|uniref:hypothetical protein n=1 Tax=Pseudomonas aeruginosa TaxID=287 RepID=UPI00155F0EB4|nr:hypothetical protein [Pseudomonas aeruginosa]NRC34036.1 hypothetical protein [Pseudomonas aeruginosa]